MHKAESRCYQLIRRTSIVRIWRRLLAKSILNCNYRSNMLPTSGSGYNMHNQSQPANSWQQQLYPYGYNQEGGELSTPVTEFPPNVSYQMPAPHAWQHQQSWSGQSQGSSEMSSPVTTPGFIRSQRPASDIMQYQQNSGPAQGHYIKLFVIYIHCKYYTIMHAKYFSASFYAVIL